MRKETQSKLDKLACEASALRQPQKHDFQWFRRIDKLLDQVKLLPVQINEIEVQEGK